MSVVKGNVVSHRSNGKAVRSWGFTASNIYGIFSRPAKAVIVELLSALFGLCYPRIFFFGYETLNALLKNKVMPVFFTLAHLVSKEVTAAVSIGSGLIGGTFALALSWSQCWERHSKMSPFMP
jgi:Voltage gated chloride channel